MTTDIVVNPAAGDWKMILAPGTGVSIGSDGLGGSINTGLANGGDVLYLYLPGPNGNSSGTDNIYLDYIGFEGDGLPPTGFSAINLPSLADNAYYVGNTAAGNDVVGNWVRYDGAPNASTTPGEPNPSQDLTALRPGTLLPGVAITQSGGTTAVTEGGAADTVCSTPRGFSTGETASSRCRNRSADIVARVPPALRISGAGD